MNQQNPFDRKNIEESAVTRPPGLLEQLNIPPAAATFIRKNRQTLWIVAICMALVVTAVSLYGSYRSYRENKASSALALAMKAEGEERKLQLAEVVDEYGSTSAGLWGKIRLAHIAAEDGDYAQAVAGLTEVRDSVEADNPVTPLLIYNLGVLQEKSEKPEGALAAFNELLAFKGFEELAYKAMGRIYEQQGSKDEALEMYKKYMAVGESEEGQPQVGVDPDRSMIQAKINQLEN